jgi:DNA-binding transcriptional ArsR family regulator
VKNFSSVRAECVQSLKEMEIDGEAFYKKNLSYLEKYVNEFEKKYVPDPEEDFFFGNSLEFFITVSAILIEYPELETDIDTLTEDEVLGRIESFFAEEISQAAGRADFMEKRETAAGPDAVEKPEAAARLDAVEKPEAAAGPDAADKLDTMERRFALIQSMDYPEETKWKLLTFMNHPLEKCRALVGILRKNRPAFEYTLERNRECLETLLSEAPRELSSVMKNLVEELAPGEITVYQTAVFPLMEWLNSKAAFQGIMTDKLYLYKKNLSDAREILPGMLKILGDKSKFEILCSLKERGKYNLEIAEELRFTPATASHHMGILLSNHFVTVEKKDGKVYYRLNSETIAEVIRYMEGVFLNYMPPHDGLTS